MERRADLVTRVLGVFRTLDAVAEGISQPTVSRMANQGVLVRLCRGLYHHVDAEIDYAALDFIVACHRLGRDSIIGGMTALFHYGLTTGVPQQTWVLIPHVNRGKFPQYRILHTKHAPDIGVEDHGTYRIVTVERAVAEAFRYAGKVGYQTALVAARTALRDGKTTEQRLNETAQDLGLWPTLVRNWDAITTK